MSRHKYHACPTVVDGIRFASKREANRYGILKLLLREGKIANLTLQPRYTCWVNGIKVCDYVADFRYLENGVEVVEDAKGVRTSTYKIKKKLVQALYGITIRET